ncbi:MAG: transcriptional repressor LexA [Deltaproteobacteria bacterium]
MAPLTERQDMILQFIRHSIRDRGYPPTLREIGSKMGIRSTNGVSDHLRALERKGYLRREDMKSRALRPVDDVGVRGGSLASSHEEAIADTVTVPVLGRVAAGQMSSTSDRVDSTITIDRNLLHARGEVFALRVKGDSMIEAGIHEGDTLFVKRTPTAERGDIVVARLGDEATVKRYFPERDFIRLQPENKHLSPILVRKADAAASGFEILGTVVGLFRNV